MEDLLTIITKVTDLHKIPIDITKNIISKIIVPHYIQNIHTEQGIVSELSIEYIEQLRILFKYTQLFNEPNYCVFLKNTNALFPVANNIYSSEYVKNIILMEKLKDRCGIHFVTYMHEDSY